MVYSVAERQITAEVVSQNQPINWKGAKVLVAGGAGMIGSHTARELLHRGAKVTVADNLSSGSVKNLNDICKDIEFFQYDLRQYDHCRGMATGKDAVFQFAADMGGIGYITTVGARIMINNSLINIQMLRATRDVANYFFSSSACVYANYKQTDPNAASINLKESDALPGDPNEFYGWEKLYNEQLMLAAQRDWGRNIRVGRFHNVYGSAYTAFDAQKGKAPCHLIVKAIRHPNPPMVLWGDGRAVRSFLYIDDCVEAVLRLMDTNHNDPINIGSDRAVTVDELAGIVIAISGKDITPEHDLTKPVGVMGRNSDNTLVRKVLGWEPQVSLEIGLARVYRWACMNFAELEGI